MTVTSELNDLRQLWCAVHESVNKMVEDLTDAEWVSKPRADFNNVASVIEHIAMVEHRFLTVLDGKTPEPLARSPFQVAEWDVLAIRTTYADALLYAQDVISRLDPATLDTHALKLGIGEVNRRQLLAYAIAHTTHHRGQIPLIVKMLRG